MTLPDIVLWFVSGLATLLMASYGWFITNTLSKIDANQQKMSELLTEQAVDIARLQGEYQSLYRQLERREVV